MYVMEQEKERKKRQWRRPVLSVLLLFLSFCGLILRLFSLQKTAGQATDAAVGERYVAIDSSRGYIYDRHLRPLVNDTVSNTAAVLLSGQSDADGMRQEIISRYASCGVLPDTIVQNGACAVFETEKEIPATTVSINLKTVERYGSGDLCRHILGYVDAEGNGVGGIEEAFDRLLKETGGRLGVRWVSDAAGRALMGKGLKTENENYHNAAGVVLTIDKEIQSLTRAAMAHSGVKKGAAVVLDAEDSAILASVSVPVFSLDHMEAALTDPDHPFLNRALAAYPVGSVFKPFVAASAIDHAVATNVSFVCTGSISVGDESFRCYQQNAHGEMDLTSAVCKSCNTYFIDLGRRVGAGHLLKTAEAFGFGAEIRLTGTLKSDKGNLPTPESLSLPAALANFSFGQGDLLASPLQLAAAYAALARGGVYKTPYLMKAIVDEDRKETAYYLPEGQGRAAQTSTCEIVCGSLRENMISGTGVNGSASNVTAAGKTATAQTGDYDAAGAERLCTWFCGFIPYEKPRYVIVILNEDGSVASEDCAPVFREISQKLTALSASGATGERE